MKKTHGRGLSRCGLIYGRGGGTPRLSDPTIAGQKPFPWLANFGANPSDSEKPPSMRAAQKKKKKKKTQHPTRMKMDGQLKIEFARRRSPKFAEKGNWGGTKKKNSHCHPPPPTHQKRD